MKKRTVTTIETHQIVIVRHPARATLAQCPACLKEVEMVSLEAASLLAGLSLRDICRRVSDDDLHLAVTENGGLVCLNSLLNKISLEDGRLSSGGADTPSLPAADLGNDSQH